MSGFGRFFGTSEGEEKTFQQEFDEACSLTRTQVLYCIPLPSYHIP
jgi:hypothetical protein